MNGEEPRVEKRKNNAIHIKLRYVQDRMSNPLNDHSSDLS
jgi:hypothetical protein